MKEIAQKERQSFTFYLSFYKSIKELKNRDRLAIYDAIVEYSLLGKEPYGLSPITQLVWNLVVPILSKSRTNFLNACKTPHPTKQQASEVQKEEPLAPSEEVSDKGSEMVSTDTDTETDTKTNTDKDTNRDTNTNTESVAGIQSQEQTAEPSPKQRSGKRRDSQPSKSARELMDEYLPKIRSDAMRTAIGEWFEYKQERGEAYRTLRSMQLFCVKLKELADGNEYRAQKILQNSMANNWSGIFPLNDDYVPLAQRGEGYLRGYS